MLDIQEPFPTLNSGAVNAGHGSLTDDITDLEFLQFRQKCGRFRVLVIGSSGTGKTTLLERLTGNSTDEAQIHTPNGELVCINHCVLLTAIDQRPPRLGP